MSRKRAARIGQLDGTTREPSNQLSANSATSETSDQTWRRWSVERIERERGERMQAQARADEFTERGIWSVEIARKVAMEQAHGACPGWRELKPLIQEAYGKILREQPEMRQRDVRAREQIIIALFNGLPAHLHGALSELRTVLELVGTARETTTFLLGYEIGRASGRQDAIRDPRVMLAPEPERRALPPIPVEHHYPSSNGSLRLHAGDE